VANRALEYALNVLAEDGTDERREQMTHRLATLDKECRNLSTAIARGGDLAALLVELQSREQERASIKRRLTAMDGDVRRLSRSVLRAQLSDYLRDVRALLTGDVPQAQPVLKRLIAGRLTFDPQADGSYRFKGVGSVESVIAGLVPTCAEGGVPNGSTRYVRSGNRRNVQAAALRHGSQGCVDPHRSRRKHRQAVVERR
jgi:hypothetical protein